MASPGVVSIIVYDNTGEEIDRGSGFFIDREGKIIANEHIFKQAFSAEVVSNTNRYDSITILARDETMDLAMIQVSAIDETPLELDFAYRVTPDERVLMVGKSESLKDTVSEGLVKSMSGEGETPERIDIKKTIPITYFPDNKDGPVLNSEGKVIGIQAVISEHSIFLSTPFLGETRYSSMIKRLMP
jgi:S1-C subfamily serine protease